MLEEEDSVLIPMTTRDEKREQKAQELVGPHLQPKDNCYRKRALKHIRTMFIIPVGYLMGAGLDI